STSLHTSYYLSLHDALPICLAALLSIQQALQLAELGDAEGSPVAAVENQHDVLFVAILGKRDVFTVGVFKREVGRRLSHLDPLRSEEHTSELQSRENLVCRL